MQKSIIWPTNSSKNKLNSEIIFIYNPNPNAHLASVWKCVLRIFQRQLFFVGPVHCSREPQIPSFSNFFFKKLGLTVLFTHLKIILLQYFQFLVFNNKRYPNKLLIALSLKVFCGRKELQLFLSHWYARYL